MCLLDKRGRLRILVHTNQDDIPGLKQELPFWSSPKLELSLSKGFMVARQPADPEGANSLVGWVFLQDQDP